jgi:hypothetical protein
MFRNNKLFLCVCAGKTGRSLVWLRRTELGKRIQFSIKKNNRLIGGWQGNKIIGKLKLLRISLLACLPVLVMDQYCKASNENANVKLFCADYFFPGKNRNNWPVKKVDFSCNIRSVYTNSDFRRRATKLCRNSSFPCVALHRATRFRCRCKQAFNSLSRK